MEVFETFASNVVLNYLSTTLLTYICNLKHLYCGNEINDRPNIGLL